MMGTKALLLGLIKSYGARDSILDVSYVSSVRAYRQATFVPLSYVLSKAKDSIRAKPIQLSSKRMISILIVSTPSICPGLTPKNA